MCDADYVPYANRPEWSDVQPLPQDDGPCPIVQIAYSDKFREIFGYLRAILSTRELSERAFQLTEDAAAINPANYTVWHFRRVLLKELKKDLWEELDFIERTIEDHPKNYQVWHHRKILVELLNDPSQELKFTKSMLINSDDSKNYHCWQHRQWVLDTFSLWKGELEFTDQMLDMDVRNNSVWNHRFFVLPHFPDRSLNEEIDYTLKKIELAPHNESTWNYLRGLLQNESMSQNMKVLQFSNDLYTRGERSPHLLGFLVDLLEDRMLQGDKNDQQRLLSSAIELTQSLINEHDKIRREYWKFVERNLCNLYGNCTG